MASIDTDDRQVKPHELGPKPSCGRSSLKTDPNRTRCFRSHEPSNRFGDRIDHALSNNRSLLVHHADRRLLQRYVQPNIVLHRTSPSLLGQMTLAHPWRADSLALVWLDPGITPCCKSRKSNVSENLAKADVSTTRPLQCPLGPDTKVRGRFWTKRYGPSDRRVPNASVVLKNFVRQPQKTFSTLSAHSCPGRVRRHVRSWRKLTPHSKAHPLVSRLNLT
jgi:hypothetical protein